MADWSGLYVRQDLGASAAVAALAYSFFTAGMTVGRLVGDAINARIGPVALLRGGALLTGIPLARAAARRPAGHRALRALPRRPGRRQRRAADVLRRGPPARHAAGARHRRGLVDGLARLPRRPARVRLHRRRDLAAVVALAADPRRRRRLRSSPTASPASASPSPPTDPDPSRCHDPVRRRALRPRRRARRLDGRHQPRLGGLGRAPRARRRRHPGRQPRQAGRGGRRAVRAARAARRRGGGARAPRGGGHRGRRRAAGRGGRARAPRRRHRHVVRRAAGPRADRRRGPGGAGRARDLGPGGGTASRRPTPTCWPPSGSGWTLRTASCSRTRPRASRPAARPGRPCGRSRPRTRRATWAPRIASPPAGCPRCWRG